MADPTTNPTPENQPSVPVAGNATSTVQPTSPIGSQPTAPPAGQSAISTSTAPTTDTPDPSAMGPVSMSSSGGNPFLVMAMVILVLGLLAIGGYFALMYLQPDLLTKITNYISINNPPAVPSPSEATDAAMMKKELTPTSTTSYQLLATDIPPLYPGLAWEATESGELIFRNNKDELVTLTGFLTNSIKTDSYPTEFINYYKENLTSEGWTKTEDVGGPNGELYGFQKGDKYIRVGVKLVTSTEYIAFIEHN